MSVATANTMLEAEYHDFINPATGLHMHSTDEYSLPESLASHVDFVSPTKRLPSSSSMPSDSPQRKLLGGGGGGGGNTPASLRKLYSIGDVEGTGATKQAATGFLKQYFKGHPPTILDIIFSI